MNRKYQVNTTPFEKVDSELKAYCLGAIASFSRYLVADHRVVLKTLSEREYVCVIDMS